MRISILSLFPEMYDGFLTTSIIKRAIDKSVVEVEVINFRDYSNDKHKHVDDTPYGGGQGMVIKCQPVVDAIEDIKGDNSVVVFMGPCGKTFNNEIAREMSKLDHLILLCGHYEGIDERIKEYIDFELSIGDYILTGGELASMVVSDAIIRLLAGSIKEESHLEESFENNLLEHNQYTKPFDFRGLKVPEVLLSGHHANIKKHRLTDSLIKTKTIRPDLFEKHLFTKEELAILKEIEND